MVSHLRWKEIVFAVRDCLCLGSLEAELEKRKMGRRFMCGDPKDLRRETGKKEK